MLILKIKFKNIILIFLKIYIFKKIILATVPIQWQLKVKKKIKKNCES